MCLAVKPQKEPSLCERRSKHGSVSPSAHPHRILSQSTLTSLKRFQCLILRLYCEMVDSHCSSSMKFPDFSASRTLFTSACKVDPANISSGTRRHTISDISTMFNRTGGKTHTQGTSSHEATPSVGSPLLEGGGCWGWMESATWFACKMLLQMGGRQTEWVRELFDCGKRSHPS